MMRPAWRLRNGLRNAADSELEKSAESCEFWGWLSAAILVVGLLAEVAIAAIHPPYDSFWEQWGSSLANALVFLGVAGEVQFGRMASRRQAEFKRRSDIKIAEANERAAEANDEAKKAQLELAKFKAPRSLDAGQRARIVARLSSFAGTRFVGYVAFSSEPLALMRQIVDGLNSAKWQVETLPPPIPQLNAPGLPLVGLAISFGVRIAFDKGRDPTLEGAATALADALNAEGIDATLDTAKPEEPGANIVIQVGDKLR